jgi:Na+-transporting NADH:ubiquinone oxidoreductase subunit NqrF
MIKQRIKYFFFYANKTPKDAAYLNELTDAQNTNPNYKFIGSMTDVGDPVNEWHGETGFLLKKCYRNILVI